MITKDVKQIFIEEIHSTTYIMEALLEMNTVSQVQFLDKAVLHFT